MVRPRSKNYGLRTEDFDRRRQRLGTQFPRNSHMMTNVLSAADAHSPGSIEIIIKHGKYAFLICSWIKLDAGAGIDHWSSVYAAAHTMSVFIEWLPLRWPAFFGTRNLYKLILTRSSSCWTAEALKLMEKIVWFAWYGMDLGPLAAGRYK